MVHPMTAFLLPTLAIFAAFFTHEASAVAASLTLNGKAAPYKYAYGESISISFVNNKTASNGAIAIFPVTNPATTTSKTFVRTCGTTSCTNAVASGTVVFSALVPAILWPLPAGSYYIMLIDSAGFQQTPKYSFTVGTAPPSPPTPPPTTLTFVNHPTASYAYGESLVFAFSNPSPTSGDFIGIWTAAGWAANPKPSTTTFVRLCGSTSCTNTVTSGQVTISRAIPGIVFPIAAGSYIAILLDGQGFAKTGTYSFTVGPASSPTAVSKPPPPPVVASKPPPPPPAAASSLTFTGKPSPPKYANKENIIISFVDSAPKAGDWIGIWWSKTYIASGTAGKVATAIRTCGTASCTASPKTGSVTFTSGIAGVPWPLGWGQYRIMLLNSNNVTLSPVYSFAVLQ